MDEDRAHKIRKKEMKKESIVGIATCVFYIHRKSYYSQKYTIQYKVCILNERKEAFLYSRQDQKNMFI